MSKLTLTCSLLLLHSALWAPNAYAKWFLSKDIYTVAHQKLLEGNTRESFDAMVQAWQQSPNRDEQTNLNELLQLAITEDCGHSLNATNLPEWITKLVIQREMVQNQTQVLPRLSINGIAKKNVTKIEFTRWPDQAVIAGIPKMDEGNVFSIDAKRLENATSEGLYQLNIQVEGHPEGFKTWVILTQPQSKQRIGWINSKTWRIERNGIPDRVCPAPILSMNVYDLNDTSWTPLWTENVDGKLPTTLPKIDLPEGRYWLSVGIIESRWQGDISVLDIQRITRPVDYPGI
ncbi:DUF2861 domain-containing protein [Photobacterium ganghwense]|uniref:DUF2861 family protein n=1 Tax=Photobacterium ganghwense TaxID=320778 RepID=UPI0009FFD7D2|nr:DUF2861 family protein [Photobacterium ganghwense]PSU05334.1 DUF2861 domain-containing protein [Photobacterium ganghwense]